MPAHAGTRAGFLLALLSSTSFGVLPVLGKLAFAAGVGVVTLLVWRFGIATALLWLAVAVAHNASGATSRSGRGLARITPRRKLLLLALGVLYSVNSVLYFLALERIPATTTSLIFYVYPAVVAIVGVLLLKRPVGALQWVALAIALTGVALTVGFAEGALDATGAALALGSAVVVAFYFVLGEVALAGLPTLPATAHILAGTALTYTIWEVLSGGIDVPPTARAWLLVVIIATVCTALSILAMLGAIRRLGAGRTSIVNTLEPAVTATFAALVLGEALAARQYLGGALILTAVVLLRLTTRSPVMADT